MKIFRAFLDSLSRAETKALVCITAVFLISALARAAIAVDERSVLVPVFGGVFREGIVGQPIIINPVMSGNTVDMNISELIFSRAKHLSERISADDKNKVFTVSLKNDMVWDDKNPITSNDVVFTIKTIQNPNSKSPLLKSFEGAIAERVSQLQTRIELPESNASFMGTLEKLFVIPEHIYKGVPIENFYLSSYTLQPVGSGPYKFEGLSQNKNGFITNYSLERNHLYGGEKPYIDEIKFIFYETADELLNAFQLKKIDGFGAVEPISDTKLELLRGSAVRLPTTRYFAMFFNLNNPGLGNASMRKALVEGVSKKRIISEVFGEAEWLEEIGGPAIGLESDSQLYNPERAAETMAKNDTLTDINVFVPNVPYLKTTAEIIIDEWTKIGTRNNIELITLDPQDIAQNIIKRGEYDMALLNVSPKNYSDLAPFWRSSERGYPGMNLSFYSNPKVDSLLDSLRKESDEGKIRDISELINSYIINDPPAVFLYSIPYTYVVREGVGGIPFFSEYWRVRISDPSERFDGISEWFVTKARVLK